MRDAALLEVGYQMLACADNKQIAVAILDAPQALHALNLAMIRSLNALLQTWAQDSSVVCVVLQSSTEKAFCAGGDVRSLRQAMLNHPGALPNRLAQAFFSEEYRLDYRIHTYPKPLLVWGNGIVMGGGLGLFAGAAQRVVTESTRIAMPEVAIGLFPDVGASYFLPRMPGRIGLFLALTGAALNAQDALFAGLADYCIAHNQREQVLAELAQMRWQGEASSDLACMQAVLHSFCTEMSQLAPSNLALYQAEIEALTQASNLPHICAAFAGYQGEACYVQRAAKAMAAASPTSLALVWEIWQRRGMPLAQAFEMELIVALHCCAQPDFAEGVRALLIDKDNAPRWQPASLAELSAAQITAYFKPTWPQTPLFQVTA